MKRIIIKFLGGFPDIESAIDYIRKIDDVDLKRAILTEAVKKLYNTLGPDDILSQNSDGTWMFKGRPLLQTEVALLKQEAALMRKSKLWLMIKYDIKFHLGKKMFEEAKVKEDLVWGQLLTFLDDVIRTRISKM